jgi:hypothetical protein
MLTSLIRKIILICGCIAERRDQQLGCDFYLDSRSDTTPYQQTRSIFLVFINLIAKVNQTVNSN